MFCGTARCRGFSLLEVTIATAVLGLLMLMCLSFLSTASLLYGVDTAQTDMEAKLQTHLDEVVLELKETSPSLVSTYDFNDGPDNVDQTAIVFPSARSKDSDSFVFEKSGEVQTIPVWQGIVVYAFYGATTGKPGSLVRYVNYSTTRDYTAAITIKSITSSTITLSDNTAITRSLESTSGNTRAKRLMDDFAQMVRDPGPPDSVELPLCVKLVAQKEITEMGGEAITAETSTAVMSRNAN